MPQCCYLEDGKADGAPCTSPAEWEIIPMPFHPDANTLACSKHVGALLTDAVEHRIFQYGAT